MPLLQASKHNIAEKERAATRAAARERLTPLEERLSRLLATIPVEILREGLSLPLLQASLHGRWRGNCHPGELGTALRKLGFKRERLAFALCGIQLNEPICFPRSTNSNVEIMFWEKL